VRSSTTLAWLIYGAFAAILLLFAALLVMQVVEALIPERVADRHGFGLAAAVLTWGGGMLMVLHPAARRVFGFSLPIRRWSTAIALLGIALAAALTLAEYHWVIERFGYFEFDFARRTIGLAGLLSIIGVGVAAVRVSDGRSRTVTRGLTIASVLLAGAELVSNVPGALDGIRPAAIPLAAAMVLAAGFLAVAIVDLLSD
jgi:hypothetical protein